MQRFLLLLISFIFYVLSFPPYKVYPLAFIGLLPLLLAIKDLKRSKIFLITTLYFYAFWLIHTHWILNMEVEPSTKPWLIVGLIVLPFYLSIFNTIPLMFVRSKYRVILVPSLWIIFEFFRSSAYTGFPWLNIAYSQLENPYFRMLNAVGGIYFTGFLIVLSDLLLFEFWQSGKKSYLWGFLTLILLSHSLGALLYYQKPKCDNSVKVLIFQPNVQPREEDDYSEWQEVDKSYSKFITQIKDSFDLVLLPESALPGYYRYSKKANSIVREISRKARAPVLFGSADIVFDGERKVYNTAFLADSDSVLGQYNKVHLVPFGEWLPYENKVKILRNLEFGQGDFSPGDSVILLTAKGVPFGTLICFESIFPYITRAYAKKHARFLVNITSDGWYGKSLGPVEHFEHLRFRAIESGKYALRSAKTGISAIIDPKGRVLKSLPLFTWGYIEGTVPLCQGETPYTKFGDFIVIISLVLSLTLLVMERRKKL